MTVYQIIKYQTKSFSKKKKKLCYLMLSNTQHQMTSKATLFNRIDGFSNIENYVI